MNDVVPSEKDEWIQTALGVCVERKSAAPGDPGGPGVSLEGDRSLSHPAANGYARAEAARPFGPQDQWSLQNIVIDPDNPSIPVGQQQQFEAQGLYTGGHNQSETQALIWESSPLDTVWFDEQTKGLATAVKAGKVKITARDPNSGCTGTTTLTVTPLTSKMSQGDLNKGEAYRLGIQEGQYDDPKSRPVFAGRKNPEIRAAYEEGFQKSKGEADQKWDKVGAAVDKVEISKRPENPGISLDEIVNGAGFVASIISGLEAGKAAFFAAGNVGTKIGIVAAIYFGWELGKNYAVKREEHEKAIVDFVNKFVTVVTVDSLDRARAMVAATGEKLGVPNDEGIAVSTEIYMRCHSELDSTLRRYIDNEQAESTFIVLHDTWVTKMSKQWSDLMVNPRFKK